MADDLFSDDGDRRAAALAAAGAALAWDADLLVAGAHVAMTVVNTAQGHREISTHSGQTQLGPVTATTLYQRFVDVLTGLPAPMEISG